VLTIRHGIGEAFDVLISGIFRSRPVSSQFRAPFWGSRKRCEAVNKFFQIRTRPERLCHPGSETERRGGYPLGVKLGTSPLSALTTIDRGIGSRFTPIAEQRIKPRIDQ
jgi:hypothetical protein